MRKINGVVPNDTFTKHFLQSERTVEHRAETVRQDLTYRAAWDHPNPAYRAEPGELEDVQRSYARHGYDPYGYPQGWTGPRAVDETWTPRTFWEERKNDQRGASRPPTAPAPTDKGPSPDRAAVRRITKVRKAMTAFELAELMICEAWQDLAIKRGDWVRLARLRPQVDKYAAAIRMRAPRELVDAVLVDMTRRPLLAGGFEAPLAHFAPDSNRKVLTAVDHEAAFVRGREEQHLVAIEEDFFAASGWGKKGRRWTPSTT